MKKSVLLISLLIIVFFSKTDLMFAQSTDLDLKITELSKLITDDVNSVKKLKVIVLQFQDQNKKTNDFSIYMQSELETKLFQTKKVSVLERSQLDKIAREQKLQLTYASDDEIKDLGKIAGADAILTGTYTTIGSKIKISARLVSAATSEILSATSITIERDSEIETMINSGVKESSIIQTYPSRERESITSQPKQENGSLFSEVKFYNFLFTPTFVSNNRDGNIECTIKIKNLNANRRSITIGDGSNDEISKIISKNGADYKIISVVVVSDDSRPSYSRRMVTLVMGVNQTIEYKITFATKNEFISNLSEIKLQVSTTDVVEYKRVRELVTLKLPGI